ncbi:diguanylate cyclase [Arcobacter sp. FWKO B]|nr:diguanylate cyclase [Arcobacter sp. FWKO B]
MAKEKGFYDEVGLDVDIKEMHPDTDFIADVLDLKSTYGTGRSSLVIDRFNGKQVVLLSAIFQESPSVLLSTNLDIKHPKDLKNKKLMVTNDEIGSTSILSMLASQNVGLDDVTIVPHTFVLDDLVDNKTDAMACYLSNEPYTLSSNDIPFNVLNPKNYGFDFYGDLLFTSEYEVKNNPERARKFTLASLKGWEYAFDNIEETAKFIYDKYNTQNKSLEALIFEGETLKNLAYAGVDRVGIIDIKKIEAIAKIYAITGLMNMDIDLQSFIDPLKATSQTIKIGILSHISKEKISTKFNPLIGYLSQNIAGYDFELVHIGFDMIEEALKSSSLDFLIINPSIYTKFESVYGLSKIATLQNKIDSYEVSELGSVIFSTNKSIQSLKDIKNKKIVSVNQKSFGGYLIAKYELFLRGINIEKENMIFLDTHESVIESILKGEADVGIIRTGILEEYSKTHKKVFDNIKIINKTTYKNFPYMVSTGLYPEWSFVKLNHTPKGLAKKLLSNLLAYNSDSKISWISPVDDSKIHEIHKTLKIKPYDLDSFSIVDVWQKYQYGFMVLFISIFVVLYLVLKLYIANKKLQVQNKEIEHFNIELDRKVKQRTQELSHANEKLQTLVSKDYLTGVSSRMFFYEQSQKEFEFARRNKMPLSVILFDIDKFKVVNDTYGHDVGDIILKKFTAKIQENLRQSDLFGRLGGEEFCICVKNTDINGTVTLANKLRIIIERSSCDVEIHTINITTSIGVAQANESDTNIDDVIKRADIALYQAKNKGRNQVVLAT